jgi:hypothetical protein
LVKLAFIVVLRLSTMAHRSAFWRAKSLTSVVQGGICGN